MDKKKKILLGITGSVAAYKACDIASQLIKKDYEIQSILSDSASKFITPLALKTITRHQVYTDQFDYDIVEPIHIELAEQADLMLIAPASANFIAKIAHGICDDLLTVTTMAYTGRILIIPAMNTSMWENPINKKNLQILKDNFPNIEIMNPIEGELACQTYGIGKLPEVDDIVNKTIEVIESTSESISQDLKGVKVLVTAGGTREPIDPVRYIGNRSSGKMGTAIADQATQRGADVVLITTAPVNRSYKVISVETAREMKNSVEEYFDQCQILVMTAAVADFTPLKVETNKIKKSGLSDLNVALTESPDILGTLGRLKKDNQVLVGFAAESQDVIKNAEKKLKNKKVDLIIANHITKEGIGFGSDYNEITLVGRDHSRTLPKSLKVDLAKDIWDYLESNYLK